MKKVTKSEFYAHFNYRLNVTTAAMGDGIWEVRDNTTHELIARSIDRDPKEGESCESYYVTDYFINA